MLGYLFVFLSVAAFSLVNITDKVISSFQDRYASLLLRYSIALVLGSILVGAFGEGSKIPEGIHVFLLILAGIIAYGTNIVMYRGLTHLNTGMFFTIGYLYLIFLFFVNILLLGGTEILSPLKTGMAFVFMGFVLFSIYDAGKGKKGDLPWYLLALVCAIGWMVCFWIEGFVIKRAFASPVMSVFFVYVGAVIAAICWFLFTRKTHGYVFLNERRKLLAPTLWGWLISLWTTSLLMAYSYLPANVVNTISISDILGTTLLSVLFLKERLSRKQGMFLGIGFTILLGFVAVG